MKLINETVYDSEDLRKFFFEALAAFGGDQKKKIRVAYSRRGGGVGGHAPLGRAAMHSARSWKQHFANQRHERNYMMIALPGPSYPVPSLHEVAHVVEHELAHNRGLNHGDMSERLMQWDKQPFCFVELLIAEGFQLHRKEDGTKVFIYTCSKGHPEIVSDRRRTGGDMHCEIASCGMRLELKIRTKKTANAPVANLDAARAARSKQAEVREKYLRARLELAEKKLGRLKVRVAKLRRKVAYYDRKAAKP